jgi:hypothetical protein
MTKVLVRISGTKRELNKQEIFSTLEIVKRALARQMVERKMDTTHNLVESLDIQEVGTGGQLVADDYAQQLLDGVGRRPGRFMPPDKMLEWVKNKHLVPRPGKDGKTPSLKSLAYLINRKLAEKGSDIYLKKRKGLDVKEAVDEAMPRFKAELIKAGKIALTTGLYRALGKKVGEQNLRVK